MAEFITYGDGGFDPTKPDNNVVARVTVDDPPAPALSDAERVAALEAQNAALLADLAKATTLAAVRAAAVKAAEAELA
jgi:hypothetical protein